MAIAKWIKGPDPSCPRPLLYRGRPVVRAQCPPWESETNGFLSFDGSGFATARTNKPCLIAPLSRYAPGDVTLTTTGISLNAAVCTPDGAGGSFLTTNSSLAGTFTLTRNYGDLGAIPTTPAVPMGLCCWATRVANAYRVRSWNSVTDCSGAPDHDDLWDMLISLGWCGTGQGQWGAPGFTPDADKLLLVMTPDAADCPSFVASVGDLWCPGSLTVSNILTSTSCTQPDAFSGYGGSATLTV